MIDWIDENLKRNINVLVHCFAGVSRSASTVIAYLMKMNQMDYKSAYNFCKDKRMVTCPNPGFVRQLKEFESTLPNRKKVAPPVQPKSFSNSGK